MVNELNALESKIAQVAALCRSLRAENDDLRQQLAAADVAKQDLAGRIEIARLRLEAIVEQIPEAKA